MQGFAVQQAKVQRPPLRAATLTRQRLIHWLDEHISRRVIFVTAEAGYGKTTLLADYARRARVRVLWYRIDEDDANWVTFLHYLVAAGRQLFPDFAPNTVVLLDELAAGANNKQAVYATFFAELPELTRLGSVALVLDDYHLVDTVPEIRELVNALVAVNVPRLSLVVLARRRPTIAVSRLRTQGEFAELRTRELRFRLDETETLMRDTYSHILEHELILDLARRTEGWAASLQLVGAALEGRSSGETRALIQHLTGSKGDVHDYLAEQLVHNLRPELQQFLMRTSVLQVVEPWTAAVASGANRQQAASMIEEIERSGLLLADSDTSTEIPRYHPLVAEFLEDRLRSEEGEEAVRELHYRIAVAMEEEQWQTSAHHYAAIGAAPEIRRLLLAMAPRIMAQGEFDLARNYLDRVGLSAAEPAFGLFLSRLDLDRGDAASALTRATAAYADVQGSDDPVRYVALANLASVNLAVGELEQAHYLSLQLAESDAPQDLRDIGLATAAVLEASAGGRLDQYQGTLQVLETGQRASGKQHYLAITLLNSGLLAQTRGDAELALAKSSEAVRLLSVGSRETELVAARMNVAWALAHKGDWDSASRELIQTIAEADGGAHTDALAESADTWTWYGDEEGAVRLLADLESGGYESPLTTTYLPLARVELLCRQGRLEAAAQTLGTLEHREFSTEVGYEARRRFAAARLAVLEGSSSAQALIDDASQFAANQRADFYTRATEALRAATSDPGTFSKTINRILERDGAYLAINAEVVIPRLHELDTATFSTLLRSVEPFAARWRDPLRAFLRTRAPSTERAGLMLEQLGTAADIRLLRQVARTLRRRSPGSRLGVALARRVAPRVFIEDLGRIRVRMADRDVVEFDVRRKVLSLLGFLVTKPEMSATRDEVVDAIWPESEPRSALNSLNQTLYFMRRVLEPDYDDGVSPEYIHHDSEVVWLDADLVSSRSGLCRQLIEAATVNPSDVVVLRLSTEYTGKFALDFSYEEWATAYRDNLHASYLHVVEASVRHLLSVGRPSQAIALTRRALEIDPSADQLERLLLHGYSVEGAAAAAREQYEHYAGYLRDELGVEPPSLQALVDGSAEDWADT